MVKVLDTSNILWNKYVDKLPIKLRDIYYRSEYYKLYEANNEGVGKLFVYEDNEKIAIYPFLLRKIEGYDLDDEYYDIETAYGYGGPLSNSLDIEFINNFEDSFINFCKNNNIVAEFIRFHPIFKNKDIFKKNINVAFNRNTVVVDLTKDIDYIWINEISSSNRNKINKAKNRYNLEFYCNNDLNIFKKIYIETMNKVTANSYYYFSDKYFDEIHKLDYFNFMVDYKEKTIASGIFLYDNNYIHYHLGGSKKDYLNLYPNNLLFWSVIEFAKKMRFKYLHLGGGSTIYSDDSLLRFKKYFSKKLLDFHIGYRVHNIHIYNKLITSWKNINGKEQKIFFQYRI